MKKMIIAVCLIAMALLAPLCALADVQINETTFPDEHFRDYVINELNGGSQTLTDADIANIAIVEVTYRDISSLKGIEYLTALEELNCCGNLLETIDVTSLTKLTYLNCNDNQLTALDVSMLPGLIFLYCEDNQLTELELSSNTALYDLNCSDNLLESLDVSKNTVLAYLDCRGNLFKTLDVSMLSELAHLDCEENQLTKLDVSKNTKLSLLYCDNNQLTALDVSKNTELYDLECSDNLLGAIDVSMLSELVYLDCDYNQLTKLDVSKNTKLYDLDCSDNLLGAIDVSMLSELVYLDCDDNQLTKLDVSKNTDLERLECANNQLATLDLSENGCLGIVECSEQTIVVHTDKQDKRFSIDMKMVVGEGNLKNILSVSDGSINSDTGIWVFDSLEDLSYTYHNQSSSPEMWEMVVKVKTQYVHATLSPSNTFAKGQAPVVTLTIGHGLEDLSADNFDFLKVDGKVIQPGANTFEVHSGSVIVVLNPNYLNTLAVGDHELQVGLKGDGYDGRQAVVCLTLTEAAAAPAMPKTGDNSAPLLWLAAAVLALACMTMLVKKQKKA